VTPPLPPDPLASTSAGNDRRRSRVVAAMVRLAMLALVLVVGATPAAAQRGWPQPAAGPSASGAPELVLTFDDGPDPDNTPKVLDVLRARGLRGVFFQVGWRYRRGDVPRARALQAQMVREGHIIANHTVSHAQLCAVPDDEARREISEARALLEVGAAMPVQWFRTPYGARCPRVERVLASLGLVHFHWDIDPQEWRGLTPKQTAAKVIGQLARLDGRAVLLMHDTKLATRTALTEILDWVDAENRRRAKTGRAPIKIIGGDQVAAEAVAPSVAWLKKAVAHGRAGLAESLVASVP
jgi:peptidoglycan/xylan/chitin deacetylase (PgdA/CDA1 family)